MGWKTKVAATTGTPPPTSSRRCKCSRRRTTYCKTEETKCSSNWHLLLEIVRRRKSRISISKVSRLIRGKTAFSRTTKCVLHPQNSRLVSTRVASTHQTSSSARRTRYVCHTLMIALMRLANKEEICVPEDRINCVRVKRRIEKTTIPT